jgi:hypothetical protein
VRTQEKHKEIRMAFVRNNLPAKNWHTNDHIENHEKPQPDDDQDCFVRNKCSQLVIIWIFISSIHSLLFWWSLCVGGLQVNYFTLWNKVESFLPSLCTIPLVGLEEPKWYLYRSAV